MEPVSIGMIVLTSILVVERCFKYYVAHVKKSTCCNSSVEFTGQSPVWLESSRGSDESIASKEAVMPSDPIENKNLN